MLGLVLLYVGIVLISNGMAGLYGVDPKSKSIMNFFTAGVSIVANVITIIMGDYYSAATGLLFGFTYLYIALNGVFDLDQRLYGWYSLFVAINTIPAAYRSFTTNDFWMGVIWLSWGVLWLTGFIECTLHKSLGKFPPALSAAEGVLTAWIPGVMMLFGWWI